MRRFDEYEEALRKLQEAADSHWFSASFLCEFRRPASFVCARWRRDSARFEEVGESDEVYAREASLGWDTHPDAATHDFFAREFAAAVERSLSEQ